MPPKYLQTYLENNKNSMLPSFLRLEEAPLIRRRLCFCIQSDVYFLKRKDDVYPVNPVSRHPVKRKKQCGDMDFCLKYLYH